METTNNVKQREKINNNEKKCKNLIIRSVHDCQLETIKDKATAKQMIDSLTSIYERKSIATKLLLKKELFLMKYHKSEDMKNHFVNFDRKVREYKSAGGKMDDEDAVVYLLLTLPEEYDNLVTAITTMDSNKVRVDIVKSHILDEYNKKNAGASQGKSMTTAMNANITCFRCGQVGHIKSQCKVKKKDKKFNKPWKKKNASEKGSANATESNAKASSMSAVCERIQGKSTVNETVMHTTGMNTKRMCKATTTKQYDNASYIKFILDSGATEHMANKESFFNDLCRTDDINISVAKQDASLCANQKGDIHVKLFQNGDCSKKTIRDVLYVKDLKCNLMSIRSLTKRGYRIVFEGDSAVVSMDGKKIFVAHCPNRLYGVDFKLDHDVFAGFSGENNFDKSSQTAWHFRFGSFKCCRYEEIGRSKYGSWHGKVKSQNE